MILNCNSCSKKFVVPDKAITASGRWYNVAHAEINGSNSRGEIKNSTSSQPQKVASIPKPKSSPKTKKKSKKTCSKKPREIDLYSPEYLAKKHGIKYVSQQ